MLLRQSNRPSPHLKYRLLFRRLNHRATRARAQPSRMPRNQMLHSRIRTPRPGLR